MRTSPQFWYSGLFEMLPVRGGAQDDEAGCACVDFSMAEMLRGGITTVMEIGALGEYVVERAAHYGLRVYMGHAFRSGRWLTRDGKRVEWEWDEEAGRQGLRRAMAFHRQHDGAHGDLVRCFVAPSQIDTCTPALLQDAKRFADEVRRPYQVHTAQSVVEFNEMVARHGMTPIAWMRELGVLGANTILGHAIIIGGSSWTNYPAGDVQIMADSGCSVAHAVWVFARRAWPWSPARPPGGGHHGARHDTNPPERHRGQAGRPSSPDDGRNTQATGGRRAATPGGARARPRRPGRIAPGAKADLVLSRLPGG
jgi:cytosine/adenosine deaminase-related metal-dependent hydrolase